MKHLILTICLMVLLLPGAKAQQYFPLLEGNPQWNVYVHKYYEEPDRPSSKNLCRYYLKGDTTIDGVLYQKFWEEIGDTLDPVNYFKGLIREEGKKIYYMGEDYGIHVNFGYYEQPEVLLYDFSSEPGDTVYHDKYDYTIIKNIDSVKIAGEYRKRYKVETTSLMQYEGGDYWIEGIGNVKNGLLGIITDIPTGGYSLSWELVCYMENGKEVYLNPAYDDCYPGNLLSSVKNNLSDHSRISIFPNPFEDKLYINNVHEKGITLKITDILGKLVIQEELLHSDNAIHIPNHHGFLIITLMDAQGKVIKKKKMIQK